MTFDQLRAFASSTESHIHQIALTKSAALKLLAEHERELDKPEAGFEINTARANAGPYQAMERAAIERMLFGEDA